MIHLCTFFVGTGERKEERDSKWVDMKWRKATRGV